jgi:hypothetical protein
MKEKLFKALLQLGKFSYKVLERVIAGVIAGSVLLLLTIDEPNKTDTWCAAPPRPARPPSHYGTRPPELYKQTTSHPITKGNNSAEEGARGDSDAALKHRRHRPHGVEKNNERPSDARTGGETRRLRGTKATTPPQRNDRMKALTDSIAVCFLGTGCGISWCACVSRCHSGEERARVAPATGNRRYEGRTQPANTLLHRWWV